MRLCSNAVGLHFSWWHLPVSPGSGFLAFPITWLSCNLQGCQHLPLSARQQLKAADIVLHKARCIFTKTASLCWLTFAQMIRNVQPYQSSSFQHAVDGRSGVSSFCGLLIGFVGQCSGQACGRLLCIQCIVLMFGHCAGPGSEAAQRWRSFQNESHKQHD